MFGWGKRRSSAGAPPAAGPPVPPSEIDMSFMAELKGAAEQSLRRTQDECRRLAGDFMDAISARADLLGRFKHMWPDPDTQQSVLLVLAADVPRRLSPLDDEMQETLGAAELLGPCVPWLGFVQKENGFACIKLKLPETLEPWVTFTNRLVVYLFAELNAYTGPDSFNECCGADSRRPLRMRCSNPL
ncbi:hypothetical protein cyc_07329 [Cyclospora cayetanensis]|uniref:Uncharacterized protein n=1 Tax=Cyclospora cayetanensis TaxID=88456 RepID=A0A1D3D625_9EIME|nr:hypothetical protein cyc_07329 [Cyclospora cayetanensis]